MTIEPKTVKEKITNEQFLYDLKVVSGARFAMASRIEFAAQSKRLIINGLSALSIFISAGLLITESEKFPVELVATLLVGISILIMWMSLDRSEGELLSKSNYARSCAVKLNNIIKKLQGELISLEKAIMEYEDEINKFKINHRDYDREYAIYKLKNKYDKAKENYSWTFIIYWISYFSNIILLIIWIIAIYLIATQMY